MATKSNTRILVVEDDATVRYTFSTVLQGEGYDVSTANDGFDALLHLQQEVPDVILFRSQHAANVGIRVAVGRTSQVPKHYGCGG